MSLDLKNLLVRTGLDAIGYRHPVHSNEQYIQAGLAWLMRAQDASGDGGVSAQYALFHGWDGSYIETTGYILETFFAAAKRYKKPEYKKRAIQMPEFLVKVQLKSGAFQSGTPQDPPNPLVFNTGEDVRGLVTAYEETGKKRYLTAARSAADWLISVQEKDGSWFRFEFQDRRHSYHSRTAWALLRVWQVTRDSRYKTAAIKSLDWVLGIQNANGWFRECDFTNPQWPFTHAIDYTIRGLLECSSILKTSKYADAAKTSADALLRYYQKHHNMPATFTPAWQSQDQYTCLTGDAQIASSWLILFRATKKKAYFESAKNLLEDIKHTVDLTTTDMNIRGGIAGAYPHFGGYSRWNYPNWATKFFVDACMQLEQLSPR